MKEEKKNKNEIEIMIKDEEQNKKQITNFFS